VLQIHGEQDELVPLRTAHELGALLEGASHTLVTIPGAGHNDLLWLGRERYFEAIRAFVDGARSPR
jgi:pimeloyl-ACP methyl ester carboxylesterase